MKKILLFDYEKNKQDFSRKLIEKISSNDLQFIHFFKKKSICDLFCIKDKKGLTIRHFLYKMLWSLRMKFLLWRHDIEKIVFIGQSVDFIFLPYFNKKNREIFWLETGSEEISSSRTDEFYKKFSESTFLVFNQRFYDLASFKAKKYKIQLVKLNIGIKNGACSYQKNIFDNLAGTNKKGIERKFFALGAILNLDQKEQIELLFRVAAICKNLIPKFQLMIIGDGKFSPKNDSWIKWLSKKMKIDTIVWFVEGDRHLKKWLDGLDILVLAHNDFLTSDFENSLLALSGALPVLAPSEIGFEEIIKEGVNGAFYEADNSELLADKALEIYKNRNIKNSSQDFFNKELKDIFKEEKLLDDLKKVLNN